MVHVSQSGEFGLIARLRDLIAERQPAALGTPSAPGDRPGLLLGIGDDCSVWRGGGLTQFATTDTMVEGVHFSLKTTGWRELGWKALAVNVSDIAAMGGVPDYGLVTLGLPGDTDQAGIDDLYHGLADCANTFGLLLAGGDIVASRQLFLTVALMGHASQTVPYPNNAMLRSAARPGDAVAVTGTLGLSAAGLALLQAGGDWQPALDAHRRPQPRVAAGQLALEAGARCAMDVSDGLAADLGKLCTASGVAATVQLTRLPVHPELAGRFPTDWAGFALSGGEDYELLLVAPPEVLDAIGERSDVPVTTIGRIKDGPAGQVTVLDGEGRPVDVDGGWDHLAGAAS